ncbi:MAG: zf-HC2 domain-containing protein [Myxococcales bacterium]|nr:zf-HC2 domain-containing protein [Myxococcales bacterium]
MTESDDHQALRCEDCQAALVDYVFGELPAEPRGAVSRHLTSCPACALAFCRHREDLEGLSSEYAEAPSARVREALRRRVADEFTPGLWRRLVEVCTRPVPAYGVVLAACAPVVAWLFLSTGSPRPRPSPEPDARAELHESSRPPRIADYDASFVLPPDPDLL